MASIDRDLISNKTSCYIFDIDGCLANVDNIVLTYAEAYKKELEEFNNAQEKYRSDCKAYEYDLKQYNKNLTSNKPIEPIPPIKPAKPESSKLSKWDADYFYRHLQEALPIGGIVDLFIAMALTKKVILLTGRSESSKSATIDWLNKVITERSTKDMFRRINFITSR